MAFDVEKVRQDFACLANQRGNAPIYLDNACMTLKPEPVLAAMLGYYREHPSCHRRAAHAFGRRTTERLDGARRAIRRRLGAGSGFEVVFTRNTTEAVNLVARALPFAPGDVVVTSDAEHNSNLLPWQHLARTAGVVHRTFSVPPRAALTDLSELEAWLARGRVRLVSVAHTSHVTGAALPVGRIVSLAHRHGALALVDAAQALPHGALHLTRLDADFVAVSFHKAFGPTGTGALCGRLEALRGLEPFLYGGETVEDADYGAATLADVPERFEAGLQDYAGILGAAAALEYLARLVDDGLAAHEAALNAQLSEGLADEHRVRLLGPADPALRGSIVNLEIDGLPAGEVSILLDRTRAIMARSGVHCCHPWYRKHGLAPSLRLSLSAYNTPREVEMVLDTLRSILRHF